MERLTSAVGVVVLLGLAWVLSERRRRVSPRLVVSGLALQYAMAVLMLWTSPGVAAFSFVRDFFTQLLKFSDAGARFVFGENFQSVFAFQVLPTIIFVSAATSVLFHLGVLQWIVRLMARVMVWVMNTSGTESLAAAAEVFVGMTESPLVIRPYLESMTRSELMAMMTAGMGTVAGGVLAMYVGLGVDAGHLVVASFIAAPGSLVIAKIMLPETELSLTKGMVRVDVERPGVNLLDAACRGASDGLKLALNVGAMLIAFVALVTAVNWMLQLSGYLGGPDLTLQRIFGWIFWPLAVLIGVPLHEAHTVGSLLGEKVALNEFIAYTHLMHLEQPLSPRATILATYALCGFANFGSVAVQIGGVGGLVPKRRADIARLGLRAMIGGMLTTLLSAAIAGTLIR